MVAKVTDIPFPALLEESATLMWEHNGICTCGKRTYLFSQCPKCLREDHALKLADDEAAKEAHELPASSTEAAKEVQPLASPAKLPDDLIRLPVQTGAVTRDVIFVTDVMVREIVQAKTWKLGRAQVKTWWHGYDLQLDKSQSKDKPFRISLAVEPNGKDVLPVQQCVDTGWEKNHLLDASAWNKELWFRTQSFELSSVHEQLDAYAAAVIFNRWRPKIQLFATEGPLRSALVTCMQPNDWVVVWKGKAGIDRVQFMQEDMFAHRKSPELSVLFGRTPDRRWHTVYAGNCRRYPGWLRDWLDEWGVCDTWALIFGIGTFAPRQVVTLYADKWMVYDRFGTMTKRKQTNTQFSIKEVFQRGSSEFEKLEEVFTHAAGSAWQQDPRCGAETLPYDVREKPGDTEPQVVLSEETLRWYGKKYEEREVLADEAKASQGETEFQVGETLRVTWAGIQRADKMLLQMFGPGKMQPGFRLADDGVLERKVQSDPTGQERWVPIVPDGNAAVHLTWKRWVFLQCHIGILGAHRNADKTNLIMLRMVWWKGMKDDVTVWVGKCMNMPTIP